MCIHIIKELASKLQLQVESEQTKQDKDGEINTVI